MAKIRALARQVTRIERPVPPYANTFHLMENAYLQRLEESRRLVDSGNFAEAESRLTSLIQSNAGAGEASALLGIVFTKLGRLNQAADYLESALRIDPTHLEALSWLAAVRKSQGRPEDAIALLRQALTLSQDNPEAFNLLGICL